MRSGLGDPLNPSPDSPHPLINPSFIVFSIINSVNSVYWVNQPFPVFSTDNPISLPYGSFFCGASL